jgi:plastocyanin domain-containing protein
MKRIALVMMLAVATIATASCGKDEDKRGGGAAAKASKTASITAGEKTATGERRVAIDVGRTGYTPSRIEATAGEKLILAFTRTADTECGKYVKVAGGEAKELPMNQAVELPVDVPQDGEVRFACGMDMLTGTVIVAAK